MSGMKVGYEYRESKMHVCLSKETETSTRDRESKSDCVCERENERLRQRDKTRELMSESGRVCKREK